MLLPKRRVVERAFAWATRFRRLARDNEQFAEQDGKRSEARIKAFTDAREWNIESERAFLE